MLSKTARIVSAVAVLFVMASVRPAVCEGWSLLHPFSSDSTTETTPKKPTPRPVAKPAAQPPSTIDKVVAAPKNLLTKVGNTITGKKAEQPKPSQMVAIPKGPTIQPNGKTETKSWLPSMFQPKPPEKPKDVPEWLGRERVAF
jgi:hypothetical protein